MGKELGPNIIYNRFIRKLKAQLKNPKVIKLYPKENDEIKYGLITSQIKKIIERKGDLLTLKKKDKIILILKKNTKR